MKIQLYQYMRQNEVQIPKPSKNEKKKKPYLGNHIIQFLPTQISVVSQIYLSCSQLFSTVKIIRQIIK